MKPDTFAGFRNFDKECINYLSDTETELTMLARYSRIQKLFIKFNTTQPSSAPLERLCSSAGHRFIPNLRLGFLANPFHHRPFPYLSD